MGALLFQGDGVLVRLKGTNDEIDNMAFLPVKVAAWIANFQEWGSSPGDAGAIPTAFGIHATSRRANGSYDDRATSREDGCPVECPLECVQIGIPESS
jgi:hypothetical protein